MAAGLSQPVCLDCYKDLCPNRIPSRLRSVIRFPPCAICGMTTDGIWFRTTPEGLDVIKENGFPYDEDDDGYWLEMEEGAE